MRRIPSGRRSGKLLPEYLKPVPAIRVSRKFTVAIARFHTRSRRRRLRSWSRPAKSIIPCRRRRNFEAARRRPSGGLTLFLRDNLQPLCRSLSNQPSEKATSRLSPYLHFGHISSLQVALAVQRIRARAQIDRGRVSGRADCPARTGVQFRPIRTETRIARLLAGLGAGDAGETRARQTRSSLYSRDQFERAETHDALWNATQTELLLRGKIHGYYRMYWGKKIIEWSRRHEEALANDDLSSRPLCARRPRSEHATRISCGASACTTARGRSARFSAWCATCPTQACGARPTWTAIFATSKENGHEHHGYGSDRLRRRGVDAKIAGCRARRARPRAPSSPESSPASSLFGVARRRNRTPAREPVRSRRCNSPGWRAGGAALDNRSEATHPKQPRGWDAASGERALDAVAPAASADQRFRHRNLRPAGR